MLELFNSGFVADLGGGVKHGQISGVNTEDVSDSTTSSSISNNSRQSSNHGSYNPNIFSNRRAQSTTRHTT